MSAERIAAWQRLAEAAKAFTADEKANNQRLSDAAKAWAACGSARAAPSTGRRSGAVIPFGRDKGQPIEEAETKSLRWLQGVLQEAIDDHTKAKFRAKNSELLSAIEAELETR